MNWPTFDPHDPRIAALGNEGFGAYVRAFRQCEDSKTKSLSDYDASQIASGEIWAKLVAYGFAVAEGNRFKMVKLAEKPGKKKPRPIPDDFVLDEKMRKHASDRGMTDAEIAMNGERFVAYHQSKGTESADWSASWRTWVLHQVTDFGKKPVPVAKPLQTPARPVQQSLAEMATGQEFVPAQRRGARF